MPLQVVEVQSFPKLQSTGTRFDTEHEPGTPRPFRAFHTRIALHEYIQGRAPLLKDVKVSRYCGAFSDMLRRVQLSYNYRVSSSKVTTILS